MSEYVRSIHLRIEVDTNKQTRVLDVEPDTMADALAEVAVFLVGVLS